jgi:hypothetical protein
MATYGLYFLMDFGRELGKLKLKLYLYVLPTIAVVMITFSSLVTPSVASDIQYFQVSADVGDSYFTNSELAAFAFVRQKCSYDSIIYGDYETIRDKYDLNTKAFRDTRLIQKGDISYIKEGYVIFRIGELQKTGGLNFSSDVYGDNIYRYHIGNSETNILESLLITDCVYSVGEVQLFVVNNQ